VAESDLILRRVERDGIIACLAMAAAAWVIARGRLSAPLGVVGGGLLVLVSYRGIKSGVDVLVRAMSGGGRKGIVGGLVKFFTRYAILAGAAYVIMARLRLPPVAVFAGASSIVVAVMVEALRGLRGR
jgi:hypothetical protein